jgi:hypothetical protein
MADESLFEAKLVFELQRLYPGAVLLKNYANYLVGFPDRLILFEDRWAAFDTKANKSSPHRPNQDYYINILNSMSYASFVYPQNKEVFLHELQQTLRSSRRARISESK